VSQAREAGITRSTLKRVKRAEGSQTPASDTLRADDDTLREGKPTTKLEEARRSFPLWTRAASPPAWPTLLTGLQHRTTFPAPIADPLVLGFTIDTTCWRTYDRG